LEGDWEDGGERFGVYLGLRKFNAHGNNVSVVDDTGNLADIVTRWVTPNMAETDTRLASGRARG
jgi:hypothetical protein